MSILPSTTKKQRNSVRNKPLDEELKQWVLRMWDHGVFLTDDVIKEKAGRTQETLNLFVPPSLRTTITFSNGWLHAFKKRHSFKCYKSHGESGDADQ